MSTEESERMYPKLSPEEWREVLIDLEKMRREGVFIPEGQKPRPQLYLVKK